MHAVKGTRRTGAIIGGTALAFGLLATTLGQPASAVPASTTITRAILAKQNATPAFQAPNRVIDDPDGDALPNKTPDGIGGFMFYKGNLGRGAIYAHVRQGSTTATAATIYGNILASWELRGWETGDGYPIEDENDSTGIEDVICGGNALRIQRFRKWNSSTVKYGCWNPAWGGWGVRWF